jgi:hypothetical protein
MSWIEKVPWERIILGVAVIWGFVAIINFMLTQEIPLGNKEIVLSMTAVLGTALGAVIGAVFRNNGSDEAKNRTIETLANTAAAPLTTTTVTEVSTDGQSNRSETTGGGREVVADSPIQPIDAEDSIPDLPPSQRN